MTAVLVDAASNTFYALGSMRASKRINELLTTSVLTSTLRYGKGVPDKLRYLTTNRWLDETPVSRIITRCTTDMGTVDSFLADGNNSKQTKGQNRLDKMQMSKRIIDIPPGTRDVRSPLWESGLFQISPGCSHGDVFLEVENTHIKSQYKCHSHSNLEVIYRLINGKNLTL